MHFLDVEKMKDRREEEAQKLRSSEAQMKY